MPTFVVFGQPHGMTLAVHAPCLVHPDLKIRRVWRIPFSPVATARLSSPKSGGDRYDRATSALTEWSKHLGDQLDRQAHDIAEAAFEEGDEGVTVVLDTVGAGLALPQPAVEIGR